MRYILKDTIWVLGIATALALTAYVIRSGSVPEPETTMSQSQDELNYQVIEFEQAEKMHEQGIALFADARSTDAYLQGRIPGAIHLDPEGMAEWSETMMVEYPPDQVIITYCHGEQCDLSQMLAEKLVWLGFEKVYYLVDGWGRWQKSGLPVER